ncbi:MAG: endonuclease V [Kofleriaceae bacterium]
MTSGADRASWKATLSIEDVLPYEPGGFYKRELPCWLALLAHARAAGIVPDLLVVDGYACFGPGRPALGEHLVQATGTPVVGVAKTRPAARALDGHAGT